MKKYDELSVEEWAIIRRNRGIPEKERSFRKALERLVEKKESNLRVMWDGKTRIEVYRSMIPEAHININAPDVVRLGFPGALTITYQRKVGGIELTDDGIRWTPERFVLT